MLSEQVLDLLTAYVDDELSPSRRESVLRMLEKSAEARTLLAQMQEDAQRIKNLPTHKLEPSLAEDVLQAIGNAQPRSASRPRRRAWLPYVTASLAASLLIAAIGLLYWSSVQTPVDTPKGEGGLANNGKDDKKPEPRPVPDVKPEPKTPPKKPINPLLAQMTDEVYRSFGAPVLDEKPYVTVFDKLRDPKGVEEARLSYELNRVRAAVQFELAVKSNFAAMDRLKMALSDKLGIHVVTDPSADKALLSKKDAKVEYLIYVENLTTEEVVAMLKELGEVNKIGAKNEPTPYKRLTLTPLGEDDKQKLAGLGIRLNVAAHDSAALERLAVVLPTNGGPQPSDPVRQFINQRRDVNPGTLQILIRIRQE